MTPPSTAELKPTISAVRAPNTSREKMSRPNWSVPSQWTRLGASIMAVKSFSAGSNGAIQSASPPARNITTTITRPKVPSGWRRTKLSDAAQAVRLGTSVSCGEAVAAGLGRVTVIAGPSRVADARVEPGIEQVDDEVGEHEDGDHQHGQRLRHDVVLVLHRLHEQPADAVQVEDLLGDDQAADQEGELDADQGDHRQQRVLERMAVDDDLLEQPFGTGGADIVLAHHLEHGRARHAH